MADAPLAGVRVLVTRPRRQAAELVEAVESAGGEAIRFPVIEIRPREPGQIATDARGLTRPDICVLVSVNAVRYGLDFTGDARLAAIGPATAAAIEARGRTVDIRRGFTSEHLLEAPEMTEVAGKTVRIVRGGEGRELLAKSLERRGAGVEYLSVYERRLPAVEPRDIDALAAALLAGEIAAVVVMSVQSLENLLRLLPESARDTLRGTVLVTPSERVIKVLVKRHRGWRATLARGPQASDMLAGLIAATRSTSGKA